MSLNLQLSFDILKNSYKSIDIRALVIRTSKTNFKWKCIYLTIRLTEDKLKKLKQIHKKRENNLGKINKKNFKILYESKTIDEFGSLINDINKKTVKIKSIVCSIDGSSVKDILKSDISLEDDYIFKSSNKSIFVICHQFSGNALYKVLNDLNVPYKEFVSNDEDIFKWFDMINPVRDASLIMTMPIFLNERSLTKREQKNYLRKFYINNAIEFKCTVKLTPHYNNDKPKNLNLEVQNIPVDRKQNLKLIDQDHSYFYVPKPKYPLKYYSIQLVIHYKSLIYYNEPLYYENVKRKKQSTLLQTYKLFEGYDNLYDYFLASIKGNKEEFNVVSIANILSILGFNTIILRRMGEKVKNKGSSVDIIAYDLRSKNLLLIDCTIAAKISDKINTMLNLIDDLQDKVSFIPVIITNKIISSNDIKSAKNNKIIIIPKEKIFEFLQLIYKDEIDNARSKAIEILTSETFPYENDDL